MKSITKLSSIMEGVLVVFVCLLSNHPVISEREILPRPQSGRSYKQHDVIPVIVNNIRSHVNPAKTYGYYSFPFCLNHEQEGIKGLNDTRMRNNSSITETQITDTFVKGGIPYQQSFRESLIGDHRESSPYHITFNDTTKDKLLCIQKINKNDVLKLRKAIQKSLFFEMYVEDLPMWGYIGDPYPSDYYSYYTVTGRNERNFFDVFTHMIFHIGINEDKIVSLQVTSDPSRAERIYDDDPPHEITFSYSVEFTKSEILWKDRMRSPLNLSPQSNKVQWFSIINSLVLTLFLVLMVSIILAKILRKEFFMKQYSKINEEEERGWKSLHGDVFRFPQYSWLFCAAIGCGTQLFASALITLLLALTGVISVIQRGSITVAAIIVYSLTFFIGGFISIRLHNQMKGKEKTHCIIATATMLPFPAALIFCWVNTLAIKYGITSAISLTTVTTILLLYLLIMLPLTFIGGMIAQKYGSKDFGFPTRTSEVVREIPAKKGFFWLAAMDPFYAGILPFSSIFVEMYYIYNCMWGYWIKNEVFHILFITFILAASMTSSIVIVLMYYQLVKEDHRWWWKSITSGGMIGLYIYAYGIWYWKYKTSMSGLFQASVYFGYTAVISFAVFLMFGSVAFHARLVFIKYIYSKVDVNEENTSTTPLLSLEQSDL